MDTVQHGQVRRRRVFYIPGYDPFPPRRYRELYRKEGAKQAKISGYQIDLKAKPGNAQFGWRTSATIDGQSAVADIDVLVWSDIVQDSMSAGIGGTYFQLLQTAWIYISTGALRRLMWLRKGPVIAALYPVGALILQFILALVAFAGVSDIVSGVLHKIVELFVGPVVFGPGFALRSFVSMMAGLAVGVWLLQWFRKNDRQFFAYYLMHDYAFTARHKGANPPALEKRMEMFGQKISEALQTDVDEVLVVGHSSGAHLAVSIIADLVRAGRVPAQGPKLALLSLGQVVPMASFLPKAHRLRADLHDLSTSDAVTWLDVSAPGDGCSFALCDPVSVSGVAPSNKKWPLVISAAFSETLSPEQWRRLRRKYFKLHFQYLCAFDQPRDYDYFQITAGPLTLAERFQGRQPSKSRIDVAASRYTSMAV